MYKPNNTRVYAAPSNLSIQQKRKLTDEVLSDDYPSKIVFVQEYVRIGHILCTSSDFGPIRSATLGCFAKTQRIPLLGISTGHLFARGMEVHTIDNNTHIPFGKTIAKVGDESTMYELAIIRINEDLIRFYSPDYVAPEEDEPSRFRLYQGNLSDLLYLKVHKIGYGSRKTVGRISCITHNADNAHFMVRCINEDFSKAGDSGSVVYMLTTRHEGVIIGMVVGGVEKRHYLEGDSGASFSSKHKQKETKGADVMTKHKDCQEDNDKTGDDCKSEDIISGLEFTHDDILSETSSDSSESSDMDDFDTLCVFLPPLIRLAEKELKEEISFEFNI